KRYGWLGACYGGGMIAGPAIGGLFGGVSPHLPFLVAAALAGITLVLSASLLRETRPPGSNGSHAQQPGTAKRTAVPGMLILLAGLRLGPVHRPTTGLPWVVLTPPRLGRNPLGGGGSLSLLGMVPVFGPAAPTGRIVARIGETRAILVGIAADAIG